MDLDLPALAQEGWKGRRKKVKGRDYISLRKGTREKGLGPYTDALWMQLQDFGMTPQNVQNTALIQDDNAAMMVAMQQQIDALQAQHKSEIKRLRDNVDRRLKDLRKKMKGREKKKLFWKDMIREEDGASLLAFFDANEAVGEFVINWIIGLDKKLKEVEKRINEFSIMDLAGSVVCPECNEEDCISLLIRCNVCGVHMAMGLYPSSS